MIADQSGLRIWTSFIFGRVYGPSVQQDPSPPAPPPQAPNYQQVPNPHVGSVSALIPATPQRENRSQHRPEFLTLHDYDSVSLLGGPSFRRNGIENTREMENRKSSSPKPSPRLRRRRKFLRIPPADINGEARRVNRRS